ncbi:MAG: hypothetical protein MUE78_09190 [Ilumatobacteraceae bacterium]|jgi:hypothetical protein|nr:hypothetical protein [Ilumatobacteraceae bacterium]
MVTITEKRSHRDQLAGFLTIIFAIAAWRGWANARIIAIVFAIAAVVGLALWIRWRRMPLSEVEVSDERVTWSRPGATSIVFEKADSDLLRLYRRVTPNGPTPWTLTRTDVPDAPMADLFGYDVFQLRALCEQHGWRVTM